MTKRTTYSKEFKLEALRQLSLGERPGTEIARDLGIFAETFCVNGKSSKIRMVTTAFKDLVKN